jgi:hypothetical protein
LFCFCFYSSSLGKGQVQVLEGTFTPNNINRRALSSSNVERLKLQHHEVFSWWQWYLREDSLSSSSREGP